MPGVLETGELGAYCQFWLHFQVEGSLSYMGNLKTVKKEEEEEEETKKKKSLEIGRRFTRR